MQRRRRLVGGLGGVLVAGFLLAVSGGAVASTATPAAWQPVAQPQPPNQVSHEFNAISCPTRSFCMAVGSNSVENTSHPVAETFNGRVWTLRHPTTVGFTSSLNGVSCASATDCTAVGRGEVTEDGFEPALAEHWDGQVWRVEPTVALSEDNSFNAVSCPSTSTCLAAGSTTDGKVVLERWRSGGKGWATTPVSSSLSSADFSGIACVSSKDCVAVGSGSRTAGAAASGSRTAGAAASGLVEAWNGTSWATSVLQTADVQLEGVACSSSTSCVAIGNNNQTQRPVSLVLSGTTWVSDQVLLSSSSLINGVTCVSATSCTAVGTGPGNHAIVEHWGGKSWSARTVVQERSSTDQGLLGVSCPRRGACYAVGAYAVQPTKGLAHLDLLVDRGTSA
jgi:hypothetical protein